MTTIPRHPVPKDSYDPKRPLNDLLIEQFKHFAHVAETLPSSIRAGLPGVPSIEDSEAVGQFIAAVTRAYVSQKKALPRIVPKPIRAKLPGTLSLAAVAEEKTARPKKRAKGRASKSAKKNTQKSVKKGASQSSAKKKAKSQMGPKKKGTVSKSKVKLKTRHRGVGR